VFIVEWQLNLGTRQVADIPAYNAALIRLVYSWPELSAFQLSILEAIAYHTNPATHASVLGDFRKAWATACKAAGLTGRLFHDLRRSGVRNMTRAGVSETVCMKISGHKTAAIFRRYNITSDDDLREAMKQTEAYLKAQPTATNVVRIGKR